MGRFRRLRVLGQGSRNARREKARGVPQWFSRRQLAGLVDLVQIVETTEAERAVLVELLAEQLVHHFGAPTKAAAKAAAEEEVAFAQSLCTVPQDSVIAVHRTYEDDAVRESFRALRPREGLKPTRVFSFLEVEGEDEPGEQIDVAALAERERK